MEGGPKNPFDYEPHDPIVDYELAINAMPQLAENFKELLIFVIKQNRQGLLRVGHDDMNVEEVYLDTGKSLEERTKSIIETIEAAAGVYPDESTESLIVDFQEDIVRH